MITGGDWGGGGQDQSPVTITVSLRCVRGQPGLSGTMAGAHLPPMPIQHWLLGQALALLWKHCSIWGSRGPEKWGALGTPKAEGQQEPFLGRPRS